MSLLMVVELGRGLSMVSICHIKEKRVSRVVVGLIWNMDLVLIEGIDNCRLGIIYSIVMSINSNRVGQE